jgi:hypothetical protein
MLPYIHHKLAASVLGFYCQTLNTLQDFDVPSTTEAKPLGHCFPDREKFGPTRSVITVQKKTAFISQHFLFMRSMKKLSLG